MSNTLTDFHILEDFKKTIARLEEAMSLEKTGIVRDSAIKRFELCFDLAWKCIKFYAREEGIECNSPRACLKVAFQLNLISYDENWLKMLDDRNLTVHIYKEKYADEVYSHLSLYAGLLKELARKLEK
ncbi:HI0074 family nucleotidyltransferase substrate-binding subunit [Candidatus Aerophobetes bacterium]|nr:HI0074 family nucleotidyltransferase substrate-binding subunit [Candidatus Aerophobetes bacterium]